MISSSNNEPLPPNELGETTKDCSMQFCLERDALSLWLSLQTVCSGENANPYFLEINSQKRSYNYNVSTSLADLRSAGGSRESSPIVSASLCAFSSIISLLLGYTIAHYYHKKIVYTQVKDNDDF